MTTLLTVLVTNFLVVSWWVTCFILTWGAWPLGGGGFLLTLPLLGDPEYDLGLRGAGEYDLLLLEPEELEEELVYDDDDDPDEDREYEE